MTLSVIIPAHGRADLLVRCLRSLDRDIQGDPDYTVCVIDDGSGLDEDYVREKAGTSLPLIWRSFEANRGRSAARNEGIRATSGDIIVFLDSDMEARSGFLKAHLDCHIENSRTAAVGKIIWPKGGGFMRYIGSRGVRKLVLGEPVPPWYFVTGNASVCRADLPEGEPYDEHLAGWGGEDQDLGMRLFSAGISFSSVPGAVTYHNFDGNLAHHVSRTNKYGKETLPVLIDRYPELREAAGLDFLETTIGRMAVSGLFFFPLYALARFLDAMPLPAKLYDYITFAAYARGWLEARRP